ncbi:MAG: cytochrome C oxidase subunit IV family protein [Gemmataceae bacterium]|nr:cytochrome C oxidase subunit IV family protein [Planctomycetia bacterium]MBX3398223.1 cytochrome C oxidase subunit IV family protein [Gemmataceae bacterium]
MSEHVQKPIVFEDDHAEPASVASSTLTFLFLAGLACLAMMIGFTDLGPAKVWVSLGVASVQGLVLTLFFMDLRHADKLTWLTAMAAVFWTFLLFLFTLTDYLTRHYYAF